MARKTLTVLLLLLPCFPAGSRFAFGAPPAAPETDKEKTSYSVGYQIGGDFRRQHFEIRQDALQRGLQDALAGNKPAMSDQEMRLTLRELQRIASERKRTEMESKAAAESSSTAGAP